MAKGGTNGDQVVAHDAPDRVGYAQILKEHDSAMLQLSNRRKRQTLLKAIADKKFHTKDKNGVIAHLSRDALSAEDVTALAGALLDLGDVDTLNLILDSPGGDGTQVERIVTLCRAQCRRFRVIIPSSAKSAATMIATGADELVMGPQSELGPIDAQVPMVSGGLLRYLSAQSVIDARDDLLKRYADAKSKKKDVQPILQMMLTLDLPFVDHCEKLMDFGRDVCEQLLKRHMFGKRQDKDSAAKQVVQTLSSVEQFKVHGRRIDGQTCRNELGLKVKLLGRDDELWTKILEYYTRADQFMQQVGITSMIETPQEQFMAARGNRR